MQGIVAVDIELPDRLSPETTAGERDESLIKIHYRLLEGLIRDLGTS